MSILLDLTSLSLIYLIIEYGGISQMFKKLDFPSPALFLEKTDIIQCNKYLPKYFFLSSILFRHYICHNQFYWMFDLFIILEILIVNGFPDRVQTLQGCKCNWNEIWFLNKKWLKNMIFIELQKNIEVLKNDNEFIMHYSFHFRVFEPQI